MMRWSSTKTYTEEDILRMQQEAVSRVHEFQTRAKTLPFYDVPENEIVPYYEPAPVFGESIELPAPMSNPDAQDFSESDSQTEEEYRNEQEQTQESFDTQSFPQPQPAAPGDPFGGLLSRLNLDSETLLIMGLLFLLYNEKADNSLLMALAYLLL